MLNLDPTVICLPFAEMSTLEEQDSEIEVLASIYEDNFRLLSDSAPHHFEIDVYGHSLPESAVRCVLYFSYSNDYPNVAPLFEIRKKKGLNEDQASDLAMLISDAIERSLGMVMIFDIISEVQEKIDEFTDTRVSKATEQKNKTARLVQLKAAEEEKCRFTGTRVTLETFELWNKAFKTEMQENEELQRVKDEKKAAAAIAGAAAMAKRLTGKEMFLANDHFDDSDLTFLAEGGGEIVEFDERLFVDIGDIDLEDQLDIDGLDDDEPITVS